MPNVQIALTHDTAAGLIIGAVLCGALMSSRLFRNLLLAGAATLIVVIYFRFGIAGLLKMWSVIVLDSLKHQQFAWGFGAGVLIAGVTLWTNRPRRRRR